MNKRRARRIDKNVYTLIIYLPVLALHEKYGWGSKKRLPDLAGYMADYLSQIESGDLTIHEVVREAERLSGVKLIDAR